MNKIDLGNDDPKKKDILSIIRVFENNSDKLDQVVKSVFQREHELSPLVTQPGSQPEVDQNQQTKQRLGPASTKGQKRTMSIDSDSSFSPEFPRSLIITLKITGSRQTSAVTAPTPPATGFSRRLRSRKGKELASQADEFDDNGDGNYADNVEEGDGEEEDVEEDA